MTRTVVPLVRRGDHRRLGASYDGAGTNFAVWAPDADRVELCLFDGIGTEIPLGLPECTDGVWHGYAPGVEPGTSYGFRADGPWDPSRGHLFNRDKLLLDPYARAIDGTVTPSSTLPAMVDGARNPGDSARSLPRSVVVGPDDFDWRDESRPGTPWERTVIYEAHVKGLTRCAPRVAEHLRGTFAGLAADATLEHLVDLGVTAVELLPVQHFLSELPLLDRGLVNFWGYNTIGFFAPHAAYSASGSRGQQVSEFKQMVRRLHAAGLEVILDVVYNHTAEGEAEGPAYAFRGYDDGRYYLGSRAGRYRDVTGCGNTVDASQPEVLRLVLDSMRYWASEMHVDGFRVDLAPALSRRDGCIDLRAPFLAAIGQDLVLRDVKLIAEPWDVTGEGYLVGRFPPPWREWNDKYRDAVRDFWRGRAHGVRDLATRLSGSPDLYAADRRTHASINFVTAHDGFTLRDLVSYDVKHNQANGHDNRDGADENRSWNCGIEGETTDPAVLVLRQRQAANLLATLLLSAGVPMLSAGDEQGRTQRGNNNAYCQDDETSWLSWDLGAHWPHLYPLVRQLLRLRAEHPVLRQRAFRTGRTDGASEANVTWLHPDGTEMTEERWSDGGLQSLGLFLRGEHRAATRDRERQTAASSYLLWMHAGNGPVDVALPADRATGYHLLLRTDDTAVGEAAADRPPGEPPGGIVRLSEHTLALFEAARPSRPNGSPESQPGNGIASAGQATSPRSADDASSSCLGHTRTV